MGRQVAIISSLVENVDAVKVEMLPACAFGYKLRAARQAKAAAREAAAALPEGTPEAYAARLAAEAKAELAAVSLKKESEDHELLAELKRQTIDAKAY